MTTREGGGCNYETSILSRLICVYRLYKAVERESSKTNKLDRKQTKTGWRRVKKDEQDMSKIMRKRSRRKRREENVCASVYAPSWSQAGPVAPRDGRIADYPRFRFTLRNALPCLK